MFDLVHITGELDRLVFGRVTKVGYDDKHVAFGEGDERVYRHFYGYVRCLENPRRSLWFKKEGHRSTVYLGPVYHESSITTLSTYPKVGDVLVGIPCSLEKGEAFSWWAPSARPLYELRTMLRKKDRNSLKHTSRMYQKLKSDDLYVFARLLLGDVDTLTSQMLDISERPRHPVKKNETGHQRKKGFELRWDPIPFAFFTSMMTRDRTVLEKVLERFPSVFTEYTAERLESCLAN